jgi:hypothetical protein
MLQATRHGSVCALTICFMLCDCVTRYNMLKCYQQECVEQAGRMRLEGCSVFCVVCNKRCYAMPNCLVIEASVKSLLCMCV